MQRTAPALHGRHLGAWWFAPLLFASAGCGVTLHPGRPAHVDSGALTIKETHAAACKRSPGGAGATYRADLPGAVTDPDRMRALSVLPPAARRTALAAGLEPLIADLLLARERAGDQLSLDLVARRQRLDAALNSLQPQLLAMEFEAECTVALMAVALADHGDLAETWALRFTVASLIVGATASLGAGLWELAGTESDGPLIVGLLGAGVTTALGVAALIPRPHPIVFIHEHNLLAPIERGEDPDHLYPTFVFRMLSLPTVTGAPSPREHLRTTWRDQIANEVPSGRRAIASALLWGGGGVYDEARLALRKRMFEELESTLDSFARDIDLLAATLAQLIDVEPPPAAAGMSGR